MPIGAHPPGGLDPVVDRQCGVNKPNATLAAYVGSVSLVGNPLNAIKFGGQIDVNYPDEVGIIYSSRVTTPPDFTILGTGGWNFVQLITPNRHWVLNGTPQQMAKNGYLCLDSRYPYDPGPFGQHPGQAGFYPANGSPGRAADGPSSGLAISSGDLDRVDVADGFGTWLMYLPPGGDSRYVPLRKFGWYWHGAANRDPNRTPPWLQTTPTDNCGWGFDGPEYPDHPEWQHLLIRTDLSDYVNE